MIRRMRQLNACVGIVAISGGLCRSSAAPLDVLDFVAKVGANATLKKPIPSSDLVDCVDRVLKRNPPQAQEI